MSKENRKSTKKRASKAATPKGKKESKSPSQGASPRKLESLNYIDGKHTVEQIKDLEQLVGIKETNPYGTTSLEVLEARMSEMNMWELQEFAVKVGVFPSGTRTALKTKMAKEFQAYNQGKGRHVVLPGAKSVGSHLSKDKLEKVLDLTKKGL
tara:strand:+ start:1235 stop:1693 length:459 start_codon:yes stop_codon:yes gene_type:complete